MNNDEYMIEAQSTLFVFQMLEEALKMRIGLFYEINEALKPRKFDPDKLMNTPLAPLIDMYKTASGDVMLVQDMQSTVPWRNFCAHNACLHWLYSKINTSPFTTHSVDDLRQVKKFSLALIERVAHEIKSLQLQTSQVPRNVPMPTGPLPSSRQP